MQQQQQQQQIRRPRRRRRPSMIRLLVTAVALVVTVSTTTNVAATETTTINDDLYEQNHMKHVVLDENSVVMITGAAGFIGSELAMALYRTYAPKKLICIDSMDAGFGTVSSTKSELDLALFEFKRQRVFHMLQTVDPTSMFFYRVDIRPSIPDYFESSEVPVLHNIFEEHKDITHVIHLADHIHRADDNPMQMVIPRIKGQEKAGFQEAIFEELLLQRDLRNETQLSIQYIYASSSAVYDHFTEHHEKSDFPNPPPFSESKPLTTPSTASGAQKLIDEMLAQAYYDAHGLSSIGLRLFNVYGPWGLPRSTIFEMAEYAVSPDGHDPAMAVKDGSLDNIADWVYIDDAVDAIMTSMQLPIKQSIAINVGTGAGTSTRTIADMMRELVPDGRTIPKSNAIPPPSPKPQTTSFADTTRSTQLLGFTPQVSLEDGIKKLLAWHYDRTFPYASGTENKAIEECDIYDTECLKGTPIFPCASECAHTSHCKRSLFDDVIALTRAVTSKCSTVMYTVALGNNVTQLSSIHVRVSTQSIAYIEDAGGSHCNIAFVSEDSPLYKRRDMIVADDISMHGFWSLIPVAITKYSMDKIQLLSLLPKLSPGKFFAETVEKAIYCDPDIIFDSIPRLIEESNMQPKHPTIEGATIMLLGRKPQDTFNVADLYVTTHKTPPSVLIQDMAYRMIRMAIIDAMTGDGFAQKIDAGFIVHTLRGPQQSNPNNNNNVSYEDGRIFRCDVFGEVLQWQVDTDVAALEFILGLHDMWSRVMVKKDGIEPWWIGEDVITVDTASSTEDVEPEIRRRLQVVDAVEDAGVPPEQGLPFKPGGKNEEDDEISSSEDGSNNGADAAVAGGTSQVVDEHNGFGVVVDAIEAVFGYGQQQKQQQRFDRPEDEEMGDDIIVADDDDDDNTNAASARGKRTNVDGTGIGPEEGAPRYYLPNVDQDPSSYDVWMGVLSSSSVRFFSRMVSLDAVGVYRVMEDADGKISTI